MTRAPEDEYRFRSTRHATRMHIDAHVRFLQEGIDIAVLLVHFSGKLGGRSGFRC